MPKSQKNSIKLTLPEIAEKLMTIVQHNSWHRLLHALLTPVVAAFLCGCPSVRTQQLARPEVVSIRGAYLHQPSRFVFPESVGEFQRERVVRFDTGGADVGAHYTHSNLLLPVSATVYVYPSPKLTSFGSPANVVAGARANLSQNEFRKRITEVLNSHPGAKLVEQREVSHPARGNPGFLAIFEYDSASSGSKALVRSYLYLFNYVGGEWTIKYRFTHGKEQASSDDIDSFLRSFAWPVH